MEQNQNLMLVVAEQAMFVLFTFVNTGVLP